MGDKVVGMRMEDNRGRWRRRVVHTNVPFWLTGVMPVGHEGGEGKMRWKERGRRTHQSGVVSIYII